MKDTLIFSAGSTKACHYARQFLSDSGLKFVDHPTPEITHLLLDVPALDSTGNLRGGGPVENILERLPCRICVVGGNLNHPALDSYCTMDLLKDAEYTARNAAITAQCALQAAMPLLDTTLSDTPTLIIGWGRIGKCLGHILRSLGTDVTVAARKEADRAMLKALGYGAVDIPEIPRILPNFRLLCNTVPFPILSVEELVLCRNGVKLELASQDGLAGADVVIARGLPGLYAPESSGRLIADTILRLIHKEG